MFRWFKRSAPVPPFSAANPGQGAWVRTGFANGERTWTEEANALDALAAAQAYSAALVILGRRAPAEWRRGADRLLFVPERPYFSTAI